MLLQLHVKNFALIDEAEVEFKKGLNILTGETGAGKSVLLGSVNLALGSKADKSMIRHGAEYALVELVFQLENEQQRRAVLDMDLPLEEGDILILQRKIMESRSVNKVCGETVSAAQLKELAPILLDVYGQHDYQSLLQPKKHLAILDSFGGDEVGACLKDYRKAYDKYISFKYQLEAPELSESERERELSFARFEADEIAAAKLVDGELEDLEKLLKRMESAEKLTKSVSGALFLLNHADHSCVSSLEHSIRELRGSAQDDESVEDFTSRLDRFDIELTDLIAEMESFLEEISFDEREYSSVRERVDLINHLQMKYGKNTQEVLLYEEKKRERIAFLENLSEEKEKLEKEFETARDEVSRIAGILRELRKTEASKLEKEIMDALEDLNFLQAKFEIAFTELNEPGINGADGVSFLISTNPGEPLKPLAQVASGGELSRIMLAVKTISARRDEINTLIFDEIDSGISGKTAWKVAEKLASLAREHQVISITHLPQIAAMADTHFNIIKEEKNGKSETSIVPLDENGTLEELARLLGGGIRSDAAMDNAKELREQAKKHKMDN